MRFKVRRTSEYDSKPCEGAYQYDCLSVDERTVGDPVELKIPWARETWYKDGSNHRVEDGHIKRDFEETVWAIDIPDLAALRAFAEDKGEIIISVGGGYRDDSGVLATLEIYDDYRE